jgi:hypothetical protein
MARIEEHQGVVRLTPDDPREEAIIHGLFHGDLTIRCTPFDHYSDSTDEYKQKAKGIALERLYVPKPVFINGQLAWQKPEGLDA